MSTNPSAKYFRPSQYLFHENDQAQSIFVIKKGTIAIRKRKGAAFIELGRIYANEVIGELSFFDRAPRSAAAIALTEVEVLEIPFESLEKIFQTTPGYMKTIVAAMAERLRKSGDIIRRLDSNTIRDGEGAAVQEDELSATDVLAVANEASQGQGQGQGQGEGEGEGQGKGEGQSQGEGEGQGKGEGQSQGEGEGQGSDESNDDKAEDDSSSS